MLESGRANQTRLKTASEFRRQALDTDGFGKSLTRHALFAVYSVSDTDNPQTGLQWLKDEVPDFWRHKKTLVAMLDYFAKLGIEHWGKDLDSARLLAGTVDNYSV